MERASSALSIPTNQKWPVWTTLEARPIAGCLLKVRGWSALAMGNTSKRFQQLQQTRRRTVKFWSLLESFVPNPTGFVRLGMCRSWSPDSPQIAKLIPEFVASYVAWAFYFISVNLNFLFLLLPERRLPYSLGLSSTSESEKNTDISVQWSWNQGAVKFYMNTKLVPHGNPK